MKSLYGNVPVEEKLSRLRLYKMRVLKYSIENKAPFQT